MDGGQNSQIMKSYYLKIKKRYLKITGNEKFKKARNSFLVILLILGNGNMGNPDVVPAWINQV